MRLTVNGVEYEVVREVPSSGAAATFHARRAGTATTGRGSAGGLVLARQLRPSAAWDAELTQRAAADFLDAAQAQQEVARATRARAWASVEVDREQLTTAGELAGRSAFWLMSRRVPMGSADLHRLADSVVAGLRAMEQTCGRPHGNLKPTNVLVFGGRGRVRAARVALCDPAPARLVGGSTATARASDLAALGRTLFQLVTHRPFNDVDDFPVTAERLAGHLDRRAGEWAALLNELLAFGPGRQETASPSDLDELAQRLRRLRPRRTWPAAAAVTVLLMAGAGAAWYAGALDGWLRKSVVTDVNGRGGPRPATPMSPEEWHALIDDHAGWLADFALIYYDRALGQHLRPDVLDAGAHPEKALAAALRLFPEKQEDFERLSPRALAGLGGATASALKNAPPPTTPAAVEGARRSQELAGNLKAAIGDLAARQALRELTRRLPEGGLRDGLERLDRATSFAGGAPPAGSALARRLQELLEKRDALAASAALFTEAHRLEEARRREAPPAAGAQAPADAVLDSAASDVGEALAEAGLDKLGERAAALAGPLKELVDFVAGPDWAEADREAFYKENAAWLSSAAQPGSPAERWKKWREAAEQHVKVSEDVARAHAEALAQLDASIASIGGLIGAAPEDRKPAFEKSRDELKAAYDALPRRVSKGTVAEATRRRGELLAQAAELARTVQATTGGWREARLAELTGPLAPPAGSAAAVNAEVQAAWAKRLAGMAELAATRPADGGASSSSTLAGMPMAQWQALEQRLATLRKAHEAVAALPAPPAKPAGAAAPAAGSVAARLADALHERATARYQEATRALLGQIDSDAGMVPSAAEAAGKALGEGYAALATLAQGAEAVRTKLARWEDPAAVERAYRESARAAGDDAAAEQVWAIASGGLAAPADRSPGALAAALKERPESAPWVYHAWLADAGKIDLRDAKAREAQQTVAAALEAAAGAAQGLDERRRGELVGSVRSRLADRWAEALRTAASKEQFLALVGARGAFHASEVALSDPHVRFNLMLGDLQQYLDSGKNARQALGAFRARLDELKRLGGGVGDAAAAVERDLTLVEKGEGGDAAKAGPAGASHPRMTWTRKAAGPGGEAQPSRLVFTCRPLGGAHELALEFARVEPKGGGEAFYLCTTEVSLAVFMGVYNAVGVPDLSPPDGNRVMAGWLLTGGAARSLGLRPTWGREFGDVRENARGGRDIPYWTSNDATGPRAGQPVGSVPMPEHPVTSVSPLWAGRFAKQLNCELPTAAQWAAAVEAERPSLSRRLPNLRDRSWLAQVRYYQARLRPEDRVNSATKWMDPGSARAFGYGRRPAAGWGWSDTKPPDERHIWGEHPITGQRQAGGYADGAAWLMEVDQEVAAPTSGAAAPAAAPVAFHHLIGNAAEVVLTADSKPLVVGGSALWGKDDGLDLTGTPAAQAIGATDAFVDVGFRLAFKAPGLTLREVLARTAYRDAAGKELPATTAAAVP